METVRICVDCVTADAYGPDAEGIDASWPGFYPWVDGYVLGPVMDADGDHVEPGFSWNPCGTCGSMLGGDRYQYHAVAR